MRHTRWTSEVDLQQRYAKRYAQEPFEHPETMGWEHRVLSP
jgi:hypothetical protein